MLPSDEVTPVPSTTSACAPLVVDVLAVVEEAELTYVADGKGLSRDVAAESAIRSTWLDAPITRTIEHTIGRCYRRSSIC